jgi:hypothetical protein
MKCQFCNNNLRFSHHENDNTIVAYDCNKCPVLTSFYYVQKENKLAKICFMLDRVGSLYIWTNNYLKNCSYITDVGISFAGGGHKDPLVIKFPKIMNINPDNVYEKLGFYLVFI